MENLYIERTDCTPGVDFNKNGSLKITGRSYSENPIQLFSRLIDFCSALEAPAVSLEFLVDYLNTASSKCMFKLIEALDKNTKIGSLKILWHHEMDDDEMLELGEIYAEDCQKAQFEYISVLENVFCF